VTVGSRDDQEVMDYLVTEVLLDQGDHVDLLVSKESQELVDLEVNVDLEDQEVTKARLDVLDPVDLMVSLESKDLLQIVQK